MNQLAIGIEFLTGRYVAASVTDRDVAEWPPHPGRIFMAMAAACFETGENADEVAALQWLESLPSPALAVGEASARSSISVFVPVNDKMTANKSFLQSTPGLSRSKQERSYPTMIPDESVMHLVWLDAPGIESHLEALSRICAGVIRIGHSSSLVRVWIEQNGHIDRQPNWLPTKSGSTVRLRVPSYGELDRLRAACGFERIEKFAELTRLIEATKGKPQKDAKAEFESIFGEPYKNSLRPPEPTPPILGHWQGFTHQSKTSACDIIMDGEHFDDELLILSKMEGPTVGINDVLALTSRLRAAAMSHCLIEPPPAWLGGHEIDGSPTTSTHTAFLALPYVGSPHADGHIMGMAIALPRQVVPSERGRCLQSLLINEHGDSRSIELRLGSLGVWTLQLEERPSPPRSLVPSTWTTPSKCWASVTPVVLDRFPKCSITDNRNAWLEEVAAIVSLSCNRAGLPEPIAVDVDTTSWLQGSARAIRKRRQAKDKTNLPVGDGFPAFPGKKGKLSRPQIHVRVTFRELVRGPILLGAGRFLGYGLCRPVS